MLAVIYVVEKDNMEETCNLSFGSKASSLKVIALSRLTKKKPFWRVMGPPCLISANWSLQLTSLKVVSREEDGVVWKVALETSNAELLDSFVRFETCCV